MLRVHWFLQRMMQQGAIPIAKELQSWVMQGLDTVFPAAAAAATAPSTATQGLNDKLVQHDCMTTHQQSCAAVSVVA